MRTRGGIHSFRALNLWVILLAAASTLADEPQKPAQPKKGPSALDEVFERDVDRVALDAQRKAITAIDGLLRKYRGTGKEAELLLRTAELRQQSAAIMFRIAYGAHHAGKGPRNVDLANYRKEMRDSIGILDRFISHYGDAPGIEKGWFYRGKAREELGEKAAAEKDYSKLVETYPWADERLPAYMSLADFAIERNEHRLAVQRLRKVEEAPESRYFPFALYKLAWSHYNLGDIKPGLSYLERHIRYYDRVVARDGKLLESDKTIRDQSLMDSALFFMEGYEKGLEGYGLAEALAYFRSLNEGDPLGRMLLKYAQLLRAHDHERELISWKDRILSTEGKRPESLRIVLTVFEFQRNGRKYSDLVGTAGDLVRMYQENPVRVAAFEGYSSAQSDLLAAAEELRALTLKNKQATDLARLSGPLAGIYDAFTRFVPATDARIPGVHYNLAEALFQIREFEQATAHYRWIVDSPKASAFADASIKAISSRYEVLRQRNLIPVKLDARPLSEDGKTSLASDSVALLDEWIGWIDIQARSVKPGDKTFENFAFESDRALYASGRIRPAVDRLISFIRSRPESQFAAPAASLVLDTYHASSEWQELNHLAEDCLKLKVRGDDKFVPRLRELAADSYFKIVERPREDDDAKDALASAEEFLRKYPNASRRPDGLSLAAGHAIRAGENAKAIGLLNELIAKHSSSQNVPPAIVARAGLLEHSFRFAEAAADYRRRLEIGGPELKQAERDRIRSRALELQWLAGEHAALKDFLDSRALCPAGGEAPNAAECDRYRALHALATGWSPKGDKLSEEALEKAIKGFKENRTLWAAVALRNPKPVAFRDRILLSGIVASGWDALEPRSRFAVLPEVSRVLPEALRLNGASMAKIAPLSADESSIKRRVRLIGELEEGAGRVMKLPWARIRAEALNVVAEAYLELASGLISLPAPKGLPDSEAAEYDDTIRKLALPFEEKGQEIRGKAFELASRSSIEAEAHARIAEAFFKDNPSQASKLTPEQRLRTELPTKLAPGLLAASDPDGDWEDLLDDHAKSGFEDDPGRGIRALWLRAHRSSNWGLAAFAVQEADARDLAPPAAISLMRALSFSAAGAHAEAIAELEEAQAALSGGARRRVLVAMITSTFTTLARERTRELLEQLDRLGQSGLAASEDSEHAFLISYAAKWSGASLSPDAKGAIAAAAHRAKSGPKGDWMRKNL